MKKIIQPLLKILSLVATLGCCCNVAHAAQPAPAATDQELIVAVKAGENAAVTKLLETGAFDNNAQAINDAIGAAKTRLDAVPQQQISSVQKNIITNELIAIKKSLEDFQTTHKLLPPQKISDRPQQQPPQQQHVVLAPIHQQAETVYQPQTDVQQATWRVTDLNGKLAKLATDMTTIIESTKTDPVNDESFLNLIIKFNTNAAWFMILSAELAGPFAKIKNSNQKLVATVQENLKWLFTLFNSLHTSITTINTNTTGPMTWLKIILWPWGLTAKTARATKEANEKMVELQKIKDEAIKAGMLK